MQPLEEILASLLPEGCTVAACPLAETVGALPRAEAAAVERAAPARQREFAAGRHCAREALKRLGCPARSVPRAADGRPRWPEAVRGSISHTSEWAAAVAGRRDAFVSLGLDMELGGRIDERIAQRVLTEEERLAIRSGSLSGERDPATVLFCGKEALYKCLYPRLKRWIGFHEAVMTLAPEAGRLQCRGEGPLAGKETLSRMEGRYAWWGRHAVCVLWQSADEGR